MPLLGRHKTAQTTTTTTQQPQNTTRHCSPQQITSSTMTSAQRPAVCESPLFGIRRQLPIVSLPSNIVDNNNSNNYQHSSMSTTTTTKTTNRSRSSNDSSYYSASNGSLSNNNNNINSMSTSDYSTTGKQQQQQENTLNSIPKHITRQQIHYAFSIMDTNSDGLIDLRDLSQMLANLGIPIDESILAHVLTGASKRADHRISESEFLDWISNFMQVNDNNDDERTSYPASNRHGSKSDRTDIKSRSSSSSSSASGNKWSTGKWRGKSRTMVRSSTAASSLAAVGGEPVPVDSLRKRRGSGSGLALMRSLSSSASSTTSPATNATTTTTTANTTSTIGTSSLPSTMLNSFGANNSNRDDADESDHQRASDDDSDSGGGGGGGGSNAWNDQQEEARCDLRAAFCVFDLDGDGFITLDEVRAGLKLLGESWTPGELNQLFNRCPRGTNLGQGVRSPSLRANDLRQRISIEDFVQMLL